MCYTPAELCRELLRPAVNASWAVRVPGLEMTVAQVSIEFDVATAAAVGPAVRELEQAGYELLDGAREEP
jgi:hypothetical protein